MKNQLKKLGVYLLLLFTFIINPSRTYAAIVINEFLPKVEDPKNQWIELYNNGSDAVSLDRWKIEQTGGEKKSFTLNASAMLQSKGYFVITGAQSGIVMDRNGDTIKLIDDTNKVVDSQSYFGVIGYFTAVGRSVDGEGVFIPCYLPTQGEPNKCPAPTPAPTSPPPPPSSTPLPTATNTPTLFPLPTQNIIPTNPPISEAVKQQETPEILGTSNIAKPTVSKKIIGAVMAIIVSILWLVGIIAYQLVKRIRK